MPNCYTCQHRQEVPGSAHSMCDAGMNALFDGIHNGPKVVGAAHGIKSGWFMWPFNFDPVWLESCDSHKPK